MKQKLLTRIGALERVTPKLVPPEIRIIFISSNGDQSPEYVLEGAGLELAERR